jgi:hypothetical protein
MRPHLAVLFALSMSCAGETPTEAPKVPNGWIRSAGEGWEVWAPGSLAPPFPEASGVLVYKEGMTNVWKISWEMLPCTPTLEQARELLRRRNATARNGVEPDRWNEQELDVGGMAATKVRWSALGVEALTYDIVVGARLQRLEVVGLGAFPSDGDSFVSTHRATVVSDALPACTAVPPEPEP